MHAPLGVDITTIVSRSAMEDRQLCEQRRYWGYHWRGTGLAPVPTPRALQLGTDLHELMPVVWASVRRLTEDGAEPFTVEHRDETLGTLLETVEALWPEGGTDEQRLAFALAYAWTYQRLPLVLEEWRVLSVEEQTQVPLGPGLVQPIRMDVVLEHRDLGGIGTIDFKTVGAYSQDWAAKFERDLQTITYCEALTHLGRPVLGIQFEGLVKGKYEAPKTGPMAGTPLYGSVLVSPYLEGDNYVTRYKAGKTVRGSLRTFGAIASWMHQIALHDPAVLEGQLLTVPLHMPSEHTRQLVLGPLVRAEQAFAEKLEGYWDHPDPTEAPSPFERVPGTCLKFGREHPCPFMAMCWDQTVAEDPLASGLYAIRQDHHDTASTGGDD